MNTDLTALKPALVWKHFAAMTQIPRPSFHEEKIRRYVLDVARSLGLECREDAAHNVYVRKPASKGMENRAGVILQAHLDMVPQKNNDKKFDFLKDPIRAYVDGDWVTADGTTLGADNGIGAAAILAVLEDDTLEHGPLEALFTATEETGMAGAFGLKKGLLKGDILLNLDSETEGELYVGCARGLDANIRFRSVPEPTPARNYTAATVAVKGLKGGHSGIQIVCQRANANKLLFRLLRRWTAAHDLLLCSVDGGGLRNAIPREAFAVFGVPAETAGDVCERCRAFAVEIVEEFKYTEPNLQMTLNKIEGVEWVLDPVTMQSLVGALVGLPNGVLAMSHAVEGLVETSSNLASVKFGAEGIVVTTSQRSSVESAKRYAAQTVEAVLRLSGAEVAHSDGYPGWSPDPDSYLLHVTEQCYERLFAVKPKVRAIHAGLECGLFLEKYPELDMVSFGPTLRGVHSPDERLEIVTVQKFWDLLCAVVGSL